MRLDELNPGQKKEFIPSNTKESRTFTTFLNQCSESIAACREAGDFLYRGISLLNAEYDIFLGRPRKNRRATDTSIELQQEWDKLFTAAGFSALRSNSIFCAGGIDTAVSYGSAYIIFPINGFSFTWSPKIYDLYNHMQQHDINTPQDLYINPAILKNIHRIASKGEHCAQLENLNDGSADKILYLFQDIYYADSLENVTKYIKEISANLDSLEKKHKKIFKEVHKYISEINTILTNNSSWTPEEVIANYGYTNKDFVAAIKSKKEVIVSGEYYAFRYGEYYSYFKHAILGIGKAPKPKKTSTGDDYDGFY